MPIIKSVSEAFSMQPRIWRISTQSDYDRCPDADRKFSLIREIKSETVDLGRVYGEPVEGIFYVGYNFEGSKVFQILATAANVEYGRGDA